MAEQYDGNDPEHQESLARLAIGIAGGLFSVVAASVNIASQSLDTNSPNVCPRCNARTPRIRVPTCLRESLLGGMTCVKCGCRIDRNSKSLDQ